MSDPRIPSQWQLKDTGDAGDQWMLRDTEQRLPKNLQLQNDNSYTAPDTGWQPIDYRAMQQAAAPRARGGWLVGTLVFLALAAVAAYLTFYYVGAPDSLAFLFPAQNAAGDGSATGAVDAAGEAPAVGPSAPITATETLTGSVGISATAPVSGSAAVTESVAATPEPTATPAPTPIPEPTIPPVLVRSATVSSGAGVNLRRNPVGSAELIRTLPDNATYVIASGPISGTDGGLWIQLALTDTLGYVSADYATIITQTLPFSQAVTLLTSVGLPAPTPPVTATATPTASVSAASSELVTATGVLTATEAATVTTAATSTAAVTGATAVTGTAPVTSTDAATGTGSVALPTATPAAGATVAATATARATPRGLAGTSNATATPRAGTPAATPAATLRAATATPRAVTPTAAAPITLTAVISPTDGLNLRSAPATGNNVIVMLPVSTTVTLLARTEGGQWLRVRTAAGQEGYVAADFLRVTGDVARLPLDSAAGSGELLLPTATPRPGAAATAAPAATSAPAVTDPAAGGLISGGPGTLTVSTVSGVNVRPQPRSDSAGTATLSWNATARALGRTADSQWVFVQLNDGATGWVAAQAVVVADGMASLTVLQ